MSTFLFVLQSQRVCSPIGTQAHTQTQAHTHTNTLLQLTTALLELAPEDSEAIPTQCMFGWLSAL